ncbi:MAG: hypothetical protein ACREGG_03085 [Candidatus Saccharimonadales bacterium]
MGYSLDEEANDEEKLEKEDDDYSTPFSPPEGTADNIPKDHPELDTNVDIQEWYDEGRSAASGVDDPQGEGILGYTPPARQDDDQDDDDTEDE